MKKVGLPQTIQEHDFPSATSYSPLTFSIYGELIKSKQTFLLLYTTIFTYLITASNNGFNLNTFLWVVITMFFAISGSTMLNMYIDRDIDALMERTKYRPLPSGKIPASTVLKHGTLFSIAAILTAGLFINLLTMLIIFLGFFFDVIVYSWLLKRRTKFSIIIGGIAGGLPAIAGRTAIIGIIDLPTVLIGLFVLSWIPLHILTLALIPRNLQGYRNAGVPMWPVVSSQNQTIRVISFSAVLSAICIALTGLALHINTVLLLPLILVSLYILLKSLRNLYHPSEQATFRIFKLATLYMAFAFLWLFIGVIFTSYIT